MTEAARGFAQAGRADAASGETAPTATADRLPSAQLSGTVVDTSGALIAEAAVQVRSADGAVQRTALSNTHGYFVLSGLAAGSYRLVVSCAGFETKTMLITIGSTESAAPLRITLG
ncbi:MAG TPA: carboxypeptidase-like regulatory domain-containing protein, partial [Terracidiphilus sp.]|nr:carboxypeptidase-like regulatory domain-containing protein [Terracidiphilus sp.]